MSNVAKVFVVLNLILAVAFLGAAATFLAYVDSYRGKHDVEVAAHRQTREDKDKVIAQVTKDREEARAQVTVAQSARDAAQIGDTRVSTAYTNLKTSYDNLAANLTRANSALTVSQDTIQKFSELNTQLQANARTMSDALRVANDERGQAVRAANQAQLEQENSLAKITELEQKLAQCEESRQRLEFRDRERAASPGGGTNGPGEPQPAQSGKILASDPRANIVVISLGSEDGVKAGYRYVVSRGSGYVGTIEVTSTEAKQSAARSLRDLQKSEIRTGDDAMSK